MTKDEIAGVMSIIALICILMFMFGVAVYAIGVSDEKSRQCFYSLTEVSKEPKRYQYNYVCSHPNHTAKIVDIEEKKFLECSCEKEILPKE